MALMPLPHHRRVPASGLATEFRSFLERTRIRRCMVVAPGAPVEEHFHGLHLPITAVPYLLVVAEGDLPVAGLSDRLHRLQPGEAVLFLPGAPAVTPLERPCRYWRCTWDTTLTFIAQATYHADGSRHDPVTRGLPVAGDAGAWVDHLVQRMTPLAVNQDPVVAGGFAAALVSEALLRLAAVDVDEPAPRPSTTRWQDVDRYIRRHLDVSCDRARVARACDIHPSHVSRLVKQHTGRGFGAHVTHLRLERAKDLLRDGRHEVRAIAEACGYRRTSHFISVFKRDTGQTPGQWRREHLSAE